MLHFGGTGGNRIQLLPRPNSVTSLEIRILISLASLAIVAAFVSQIQMVHRARKLKEWIETERPDLWQNLNIVARNCNGGHPGLKLLYRQKAVGHPRFYEEYRNIRASERQLLWGVGIGAFCIGLVIIGRQLWGWHW